MASDIGWFITFVALLRLGVPVSCHVVISRNTTDLLLPGVMHVHATRATSSRPSYTLNEDAVDTRLLTNGIIGE